MTGWPELQAAVSAALVNPEVSPPKSLEKLAGGKEPTKRFNVYRNNVAMSLITVLGETFPTVRQFTGEKFFNAMARHYAVDHLPESPVMLTYGASFPDFIADYQPARQLACLSDLARLEWARNQAYHAADSAPLAIERLAEYQEAEIPHLTFSFHPSCRLIASAWPVVSIWHAHQQEEPEAALKSLPEGGEQALINRPHLDVLVHPLQKASAIFARCLMERKNFASAVEAAVIEDKNFDIPANLAGLFSTGAITGVHAETTTK